MPLATIVIVTYNGMKWLPACLKSASGYPVIVVDNASADGTAEFIRTNHPEITLLAQEKNLGFGQGNNLGIALALDKGSDYVYLLNQDAYLGESCIEKLVSVHSEKQQFGILSPVHLNGDGSLLDEKFSQYLRYDRNRDFYSDFVLGKPIRPVYEVPFVNAAGWLVSRHCLMTVGGFDPVFYHYGEDDNYTQRVRYHGLSVGVVPSAFMRHDRVPSGKTRKLSDTLPLQKQEFPLKLLLADINHEPEEHVRSIIERKRGDKRKQVLKLNFAGIRAVKEEMRFFNRLLEEVNHSREINRNPGPHYLRPGADKT